MPLYEYTCDSCGERFEVLRRITEKDEDESCPNCEAPARKLLSSFATGGFGLSMGSGCGSGGWSGG